MNHGFLRFFSIFGLMILLAGCGGTAVTPAGTDTKQVMSPTSPSTLVPSSTPDPCSPQQIEAQVQKVHGHMREFDDASILASNLPLQELSGPIANLQRIRREAEDEQIPSCLTNLKKYQIAHMNTVIGTLVAFLGGADQNTLAQNITIAREQHDQYTLELARLLGLTVVPATTISISTPTETQSPK
jgi:hypothetical protein